MAPVGQQKPYRESFSFVVLRMYVTSKRDNAE
jgi:hypothetical protein